MDQQTKQQLKEKFPQLKSQIKQRFPALSDDDLDSTQGDADQLCSKIEQKTGQQRDQVEQTLKQLVSSS